MNKKIITKIPFVPICTENRYEALAGGDDDDSEVQDEGSAGSPRTKTYDKDGNPVSYSYLTNDDGTVTTRRVTTHPEGHQTSVVVYLDNESDGDDLSHELSGSMTASVASVLSMLKRGARSIVEKATGGNSGKED